MELYQLKYFLYAAKYENISKAAQALRVSQPSISRAVVALEKELQVELFERQGKRIILTRAGLTFREQISPILWKLEGLGDEMKKVQKGGDTIRLNAMSAVSLLSGIIKKFREEEPDAAFVVDCTGDLKNADLSGGHDMGTAACADIAVGNLNNSHLAGQRLLASVLHMLQLSGGRIQFPDRQILCDFPVDLRFDLL